MKKLIMAAIFGLLVTSSIAIATDVTTQGTPNNVGPAVAAIEANDTVPSPATPFYISAVVNDNNGVADIYNSNVTCFAATGTEGTDGWDSIKLANSSVTWTSINTSALRVNGTFSSAQDYWTTKSTNASWTCRITANDSAGAAASTTTTIVVASSTGLTLGASTCVFTAANPGTDDQQWACGGHDNTSIIHNGNIDLNLTVNGTDLTGQTDATWVVTVANITWNQTTSEVPTTEAGTVLSATAADFITNWNRGTLASRAYNETNITAWLDYPTPLKSQTYEGTLTLLSSAA